MGCRTQSAELHTRTFAAKVGECRAMTITNGQLNADHSNGRHVVTEHPSDIALWFDTLFEASPVAMAVISAEENRCVRANQALADLYGMTIAEIMNADPFTLALRITHPDDLPVEQELFAGLVAGVRSSYQIEKRYVRPDGTIRWGLLTFSVSLGDPVSISSTVGPIRYVMLQVLDITDQRATKEIARQRTEELRHAQKIDGIGRLAAGVAHDFNNLLTVIRGHAELMRLHVDRSDLEIAVSKLRSGLATIETAADRASALTAQLLAYGRRESVAPRHVTLSSVVEASQQLLLRTLGVGVELEAELSATGFVYIDPGQLGQVTMNLLLNARDAMPTGGLIRVVTSDVEVTESEVPYLAPGQWVNVSITDTGHGMSPDTQARMFEPFFTTRQGRVGTEGTGLGLAVVQRIVSEAGGHIHVSSAPDQGTTMSIYLPRVHPPKSKPVVLARVEQSQIRPNSRRILIVEDEAAVRSLLGSVLLGAHYWVRVACNAEEALRFVDEEAEPFDLVIADLMMPSMGGLELAKELHGRGQLSRVLFISGYNEHTQNELAEFGPLLTKPFTPTQLLEIVPNLLSQAH